MGYGTVRLNTKHPEIREGEIFYCNIDPKKVFFGLIDAFKNIRIGHIAINASKNPLLNLRPLFVDKEEYKSHLTRKGISFIEEC